MYIYIGAHTHAPVYSVVMGLGRQRRVIARRRRSPKDLRQLLSGGLEERVGAETQLQAWVLNGHGAPHGEPFWGGWTSIRRLF